MTIKELSSGAVLYRLSGREPRFLLIKNSKGHWDFPKGHIEAGESRLAACRREVREETGISRFEIIRGGVLRRTWTFQAKESRISKDCWFYLGRAAGAGIRLSSEHTRGGWYGLGRALRMLGYPGQRSLLRAFSRKISGMGT